MAFVGRPTIGADISGEAVDFVLSLFAAVAASTEGLQIAGNELREVALVELHVVADLRRRSDLSLHTSQDRVVALIGACTLDPSS